MKNEAPNKFFAPLIIAGITIGFLASAYKFITAQKNNVEPEQLESEYKNIEKEIE